MGTFAQQLRATLVAGIISMAATMAMHAQVARFEAVYGSTPYEEGGGIILTQDNAYLSVGTVERDIFVVKADRCGNIIWSNYYDLGGMERGARVRETPDGNYVVVGTISTDTDIADAFLMEIAANGTASWAWTYGSIDMDEGYDLRIEQSTGDIYVAGAVAGKGAGMNDGWIFKTDDDGVQQWSWLYGGTASDMFRAIEIGCNGYVIATGYSNSHGTFSNDPSRYDTDVFTIRASMSTGLLNWAYLYGESKSDEASYAIVKNGISSVYIGGGLYTPVISNMVARAAFVLEVHCSNGSLTDDMAYIRPGIPPAGAYNEIYDMQVLPSQDIVTIGVNADNRVGGRDMQIMKINALNFSLVWERIYGGTGLETGQGLVVADDNPYDDYCNVVGIGSAFQLPKATLGSTDMYMVVANEVGYSNCTLRRAGMAPFDHPFDDFQVDPKILGAMASREDDPDQAVYGEDDIHCPNCLPNSISTPPGNGMELSGITSPAETSQARAVAVHVMPAVQESAAR